MTRPADLHQVPYLGDSVYQDADAPLIQPMPARALREQTGDLAISIQRNLTETHASLKYQREFNHGVVAEPARQRLARALEITNGASRGFPPAGDTADDIRLTAHVLAQFPARLLPAAIVEIIEQCACPVGRIGRDVGSYDRLQLPGGPDRRSILRNPGLLPVNAGAAARVNASLPTELLICQTGEQ